MMGTVIAFLVLTTACVAGFVRGLIDARRSFAAMYERHALDWDRLGCEGRATRERHRAEAMRRAPLWAVNRYISSDMNDDMAESGR